MTESQRMKTKKGKKMQKLSSEALEIQRKATGYYGDIDLPAINSTKYPSAKNSISLPFWMVPLIKQRAGSLDLTVSQYIRKLVNSDLKPSG